MQKGFGRKEVIQIYSVYPPSRRGERFVQLKEALLSAEQGLKQQQEKRPKSFNKCRSSQSYRTVERVIQKMIPILQKNASKVKISTVSQSHIKQRSNSNVIRPDKQKQQFLQTLAVNQTTYNKFNPFKSTKKLSIMNLQLIPGIYQSAKQQQQKQDNRVREMIQKRRADSSTEKIKQKQKYKLACAALIQSKHIKMLNKQYQNNNRVVKQVLQTLKCSRLQSQNNEKTKDQYSPNKNDKQKCIQCHVSSELYRPSTQIIIRKQSASNRKSSVNLKKMVFCMSDFSADKIYKKKIDSYIDFLYKVNFGNMIYVNLNLKEQMTEQITKIKVFVGRGNNNKLIKSLIKRRFWMQIVRQEKGANFYWTQSKLRNIHALQLQCQTQKDYQKLKNIKLPKLKYQRKQNLKILSCSESKYVQNYLLANSYNRSIHLKYNSNIITNHIPQNSLIGNKKALFHSLYYFYKCIKEEDPFNYIPLTFHIKSPNDDSYKQFLQYIKDKPKDTIWIVKPGENTNRGNGINLAYSSKVISLISQKKIGNNGKPRTYIVQSYINNPFLYNGRKFDIRHYMMITSINGILKGYWYQDGYIRTSSESFNLQELDNKYIHLTNDAIQKYGDDYGKYEMGNKVSYTQFQRYLDSNFPSKKYNFESTILPQMRNLAIDAIKANFINMDSKKKLNNFQIYGMDFMIDANFKPWLIEINCNPCLQISSPLLSRIIPHMIENTLRLGLDPLFPPPCHYPPSKRFQLSDNILNNLRYQLMFDERIEHSLMMKKLQQTSFKHEIMQDISDFQEEYQDQQQQQGEQIKNQQLVE